MSDNSPSTEQSQQPISVLRTSGSYANLQQQKSQDPPSPRGGNRKTKVTVINTDNLPNYSTERYYMLSEIQLKSHSMVFLRDLFPIQGEDDTQDLSTASSLGSSNSNENGSDNTTEEHTDAETEEDQQHDDASGALQQKRKLLPPCVMLYLLWRPDSQFDTPESYAKNVVKPAIDQILQLHKSSSEFSEEHSTSAIYVVVDRIAVINQSPHLEALRKDQIEVSEKLVRIVATDADLCLRNIIQGISVGLSNDFRAAPGLETCMDAILVGDGERRHFPRKSKKEMSIIRNGRELDSGRSCIGIVTEYPEDLTGLDLSGETDAVQNLHLHARSTGNWSGKGNILNFAARAQKTWRELWDFDCLAVQSGRDLKCIGNMHSILSRRRRKNGNKDNKKNETLSMHYLSSQQLRQRTEQKAEMMIVFFLAFLATFLWTNYNEEIRNILKNTSELMKAVTAFLRNM
jgi:hypothetical protein